MAVSRAGHLYTAIVSPLTYLRVQLRKPFDNFINQRSGPFAGPVELNSSRVYILPTRVGFIYVLLLIFLLLGSINYAKSLGYMLTFLLAGLGIVGMLMTWRNLAGLRLRGLGAAPVYAGQQAVFLIQLENPSSDQRYAIRTGSHDRSGDTVDILPGALSTLKIYHPARTRGYVDPGKIRIESDFPLGLFVAWTWVDLSMHCLVYPMPAMKAPYTALMTEQSGEEEFDGVGLEDFAGLKKFQPGESWRRISWKAAARLDELYIKEFSGGQPERQWIDWQGLDEPSLEVRLSMMVRLVLDAQQAGRQYGMRLPTVEIPPSNGAEHQHRCLKALALYRLEESA
jgi:uncharacterized protein (DUF58 family)